VKPLASIASNRLETWIRRISSAALFISGIEVVANAVGQSGFTNPRSDLVLAIVILSGTAFIAPGVTFAMDSQQLTKPIPMPSRARLLKPKLMRLSGSDSDWMHWSTTKCSTH